MSIYARFKIYFTATIVWGFTVFFCLSLLLTGVLVRLAYKPYNLERHMPALEELLFIKGQGGVAFDSLFLHFDGHLSLQGEGVLLLGPAQKPLATARTFSLQLAHNALLRGGVAFHKIILDGLAVRAQEEGEQWVIGESIIPINHQEAQNTNETLKKVISFLNKDAGIFSYLEQLSLKNMMASVVLDDARSEEWRVLNTDFDLTKTHALDFVIESTGVIGLGEAKLNFSLRADKGQKNTHIRGHVSKLDEAFLKDFLPESFKELFHTEIQNVEANVKLNNENFKLVEAKASARLGESSVTLPKLYPDEKKFRSGNITIGYAPTQNSHVYTVEDFVIEDEQGLLLAASGSIQDPVKGPTTTDLVVRVQEAKLTDIITYLPPKVRATQGLVKWLNSSTNKEEAVLNNIVFKLKGEPKKARLNYGAKKENNNIENLLSLNFGFKALDVRVHPRLIPITGLFGEATLEGDVLHITAHNGSLGKQKLKEVDVIISDLGQKGKPTMLRGRTTLTGQAQELLPMVERLFTTDISVKKLEGTHASTVDIILPLDSNAEKDLQFSSKTVVSNAAFTLPEIVKPFRTDMLEVIATDETLKLNAMGEAQFIKNKDVWWPTEIEWSENLNKVGIETEIKARIKSKNQFLPELMGFLKGNVQGDASHNILLKKIESEPEWFQAEVTTDLTKTAFKIASVGFDKPLDQNLIFKGSGRLHAKGHTLEAEVLELKGTGVQVLGRGYTKLDKEEGLNGLVLHFEPFIMGKKNNAEVLYGENTLRIHGEKFYFDGFGDAQNAAKIENILSGAPTTPQIKEDISLRDGHYDVKLEELTFKGGHFKKVVSNAYREKNQWVKLNFEAKVGEDDAPLTLTVNERYNEKGQREGRQAEVFSADAGAALKALGVYQSMKGGQLEVLFNIEKEYSPLGFDGIGHMRIENTYVQDAPALVRLLSLASLEQIASADKGIIFRKIHFPFEMFNRTIFIDKGKLKGPNILMKLGGNIDFAYEQLDLEGSLTPASGINSFIAKIPLVGALITGSQGALIVADFNMKGPMAAPEVTANPLSAVTPGILKDIFGGLFGSSPQKPSKPVEGNVEEQKTPKKDSHKE